MTIEEVLANPSCKTIVLWTTNSLAFVAFAMSIYLLNAHNLTYSSSPDFALPITCGLSATAALLILSLLELMENHKARLITSITWLCLSCIALATVLERMRDL